jgi:hypothetical protein
VHVFEIRMQTGRKPSTEGTTINVRVGGEILGPIAWSRQARDP